MTTRAEFFSRISAEMAKTRGLFPARTAPRPADPRDPVCGSNHWRFGSSGHAVSRSKSARA